ncbi:extracellular solute-binding protein [Paenibacillus pasadenensis]|uniref:extracellular solute-binding protein n=1 Tax=Paenibacillus pasadenensis TaxID=217090 RepID=UPI00203FCF93|nr:extracellular solute-binding protein [Paenibacillus pasadenensis]MCM3748584.1 extracellular solute-binding protein [Paenibacillus pasadenensis]
MKLNRKKSLAFAMLNVLTAAAVLAGCSSGSKSGAQNNTNPEQSAEKKDEKVPIEVMVAGFSTTLPEDDFVKKTIDKDLGIDLKLTLTSTTDELVQKLNVRAAGGDLPDVISFTAAQKSVFEEYVKKNLLLELNPYEEKLAPLKSFISEDFLSRTAINGKYYAISLNTNPNLTTFWVRKDWLDKLNLAVPQTLDELLEVSKAFTEQDPDGNGKKDTFGITGRLADLANFVNVQYGNYDGFYIKDGKMVNGLSQPEAKESIAYVQKMLASGSIDPEIASNKPENAKDKAFQGKAGILLTDWTSVMKDAEKAKWQGANPNADFVMIDKLQGPKSDYMAAVGLSAIGGRMVISKKVAEDEVKLQKILDLFNYAAQGKGADLVQFGVEGTHFTKENGKVKLTDKASEASYTWVYQMSGRPEKEYLIAKFPAQAPYIEKNDQMKRLDIYSAYVTLPADYNAADADRFKQEELLKFYLGKNKLDNYDKFLDQLNTTFKYQTYLDSGFQQLKDLGFAK